MTPAMLMDRPVTAIERKILRAEPATLSEGHVIRLADRPPYFRCSCGRNYANAGEHDSTAPLAESSGSERNVQYPFDN